MPLAGDRDDEEVAQPLEQVLDEASRVVAGVDDPVDDAEDRGAVAAREASTDWSSSVVSV